MDPDALAELDELDAGLAERARAIEEAEAQRAAAAAAAAAETEETNPEEDSWRSFVRKRAEEAARQLEDEKRQQAEAQAARRRAAREQRLEELRAARERQRMTTSSQRQSQSQSQSQSQQSQPQPRPQCCSTGTPKEPRADRLHQLHVQRFEAFEAFQVPEERAEKEEEQENEEEEEAEGEEEEGEEEEEKEDEERPGQYLEPVWLSLRRRQQQQERMQAKREGLGLRAAVESQSTHGSAINGSIAASAGGCGRHRLIRRPEELPRRREGPAAPPRWEEAQQLFDHPNLLGPSPQTDPADPDPDPDLDPDLVHFPLQQPAKNRPEVARLVASADDEPVFDQDPCAAFCKSMMARSKVQKDFDRAPTRLPPGRKATPSFPVSHAKRRLPDSRERRPAPVVEEEGAEDDEPKEDEELPPLEVILEDLQKDEEEEQEYEAILPLLPNLASSEDRRQQQALALARPQEDGDDDENALLKAAVKVLHRHRPDFDFEKLMMDHAEDVLRAGKYTEDPERDLSSLERASHQKLLEERASLAQRWQQRTEQRTAAREAAVIAAAKATIPRTMKIASVATLTAGGRPDGGYFGGVATASHGASCSTSYSSAASPSSSAAASRPA